MPRRNYFAFAMIGSVSLFCWQATQGAKPKDEMLELYGLFVDAVEKVETNYVRPVSRRELLESALEGMLQNLDPHSSYINTERVEAIPAADRGQVRRDRHSGRGGPGERPAAGDRPHGRHAGLRGGDPGGRPDRRDRRTVGRGNEPGQGRRGPDGPPGHRGQAQRPARGLGRSRSRSRSPAPSSTSPASWATAASPTISGTSCSIKTRRSATSGSPTFSQNTADELKKALDQLKEEGAKGLILDLRDDPGGLLSSAVEVSDMFLDKGEIVSTKGRNTAAQEVRGPEGRPVSKTCRWSC